ncbi:hypothetical protein QF001_008057 [Paraburkholderia youngii]|uniref:hypothetical protein n=1 Tax=Paraburkholderia youngii TaxID=2782701 RepID=UPI003D1BA06B
MTQGSIVFVHGTGVRLAAYQSSFELAKQNAVEAGVRADFVECAWGDPLGIEFQGRSLPGAEDQVERGQEGDDFARWSCLFADPLFELEKLTIRDPSVPQIEPQPGAKAKWELEWDRILAYRPSDDLVLLMRRAGLCNQDWEAARHAVALASPIARDAFEHSAHELPEAGQALARAVVAQMHHSLIGRGKPGPSRTLRDRIVARLVADWQVGALAPGDFLSRMFKRVATTLLKQHRFSLSQTVAPFIGDILLYQSRGDEIRKFIRSKIDGASGPVTVVAHSLGGIACVDLLAMPNAPHVERLVTVGSQSPLLYEIGALASLNPGERLPEDFPPWLNIFDRNDMLSYVASQLFPQAEDFEAQSGQPFPDAHSAYFTNDLTWAKIHDFIQPK